MKATKTNLRKVIDWSSSRYSEWRKEEVVAAIYAALKAGEGARSWSTGSYSESGHLGGWIWRVDGAARTVTREPGFKGEDRSVFTFDA